MKNYNCNVCNGTFANKKQVLVHFKKAHIEYKEDCLSPFDIKRVLRNHFPNCSDIQVIISNIPYIMYELVLEFHNNKVIHYCYADDHNTIENSELLNKLLSQLREKVALVEEMLLAFKSLGDLMDVYCSNFTYGYTELEHHYTFGFLTKDDMTPRELSFFPNRDGDKERVMNIVRSFFIKEVEGISSHIYEDGFIKGYEVNGIPVFNMLETAKKVKVSILEGE